MWKGHDRVVPDRDVGPFLGTQVRNTLRIRWRCRAHSSASTWQFQFQYPWKQWQAEDAFEQFPPWVWPCGWRLADSREPSSAASGTKGSCKGTCRRGGGTGHIGQSASEVHRLQAVLAGSSSSMLPTGWNPQKYHWEWRPPSWGWLGWVL